MAKIIYFLLKTEIFMSSVIRKAQGDYSKEEERFCGMKCEIYRFSVRLPFE